MVGRVAVVVLLIVVGLQGTCVHGWEGDDDNGEPIGMKFAISQKGLTYMISTVQAKVLAAAKSAKIPDRSGHEGPCDYHFHGGHVQSISSAPFQIRTVAGTGVEVDVTKITIQAHVSYDFKCCKKILRHKFCKKFGGWASIRWEDASIHVAAALGAAGGKPTLSLSSVKFVRRKLVVTAHSHYADKVAHGIWAQASQSGHIFESSIRTEFNKFVKPMLDQLPLIKKFDEFVEVDLSVVVPPHITGSAVTTLHKGEVYAIAHHHEAPFPASPMPDMEGDSMAQVFLGDYLLNSAGFAYYDAGVLHRTIADKDIPPEIPVRLNTKTFEEIFPSLFAKYPNKMMTIDVTAPKSPIALMVEGKIVESIVVDLGFNVLDPTAQRAFVLSVAVDANAVVRVESNVIKGHADLVKMDIKVKESAIGPLDVELCKPLFEMVVQQMVIPKVNVKLEQGFELPVVQGFHLVRASIAVKPGYLVLSTDVQLRVEELSPFQFEVWQALEPEAGIPEGQLPCDDEYWDTTLPLQDAVVDGEEPIPWL
jgi:hypothetical protein